MSKPSNNLQEVQDAIAISSEATRIVRDQYRSTLALAVEFGFKGMEKGWNLEQTLAEFQKVIKGER